MNRPDRVIDLTEYQRRDISQAELDETDAQQIWSQFGKQISVDPPSFRNNHQWGLTPNGYVGYLAVNRQLGLRLLPKVSLSNLFRMLEYAYRMKVDFANEWSDCEVLDEFYERLAIVLAKRVMQRCSHGLYHDYQPREEYLGFVRGRMDVYDLMTRPHDASVLCKFEEHTPDLEDNQILLYTLRHIYRNTLCGSNATPYVRQALHMLPREIKLRPFTAQDCVKRLYHRLSEDYEPMHALCRFFLECSGPTHQEGDRRMLPFVIDMALLFEQFVAEWLRSNLAGRFRTRTQNSVHIDDEGRITSRIDVVLEDRMTGRAIAVLDTKYKKSGKIHDDLYQIVTYALLKGCNEALLVYPGPPPMPATAEISGIQVRTLTFDLSGDLDVAGAELVDSICGGVSKDRVRTPLAMEDVDVHRI